MSELVVKVAYSKDGKISSVNFEEGADTESDISEESAVQHSDETPDSPVDNFLAHYGVMGMRWGKRKQAANYENNQVKRDRQVYGDRGTRRINKELSNGTNISTARGYEKTRRDRVMSKNKYARQGGKVAGAVAGGAVGLVGASLARRAANSSTGRSILNSVLGREGGTIVSTLISNPIATGAITLGAAKVGEMMSGDIGVAVNMRSHGYDPNRR